MVRRSSLVSGSAFRKLIWYHQQTLTCLKILMYGHIEAFFTFALWNLFEFSVRFLQY